MKQRDLLLLVGCGALGVLVVGAGVFGAGVAWWAVKASPPPAAPTGSSSAEIVTISMQYILRACSGRVLGPDAAVGHIRVALPLESFLL